MCGITTAKERISSPEFLLECYVIFHSELTSTIKPKRKKKPVDDGISTIQRERLFTLERQRSTPGIEDSSLSARKAPTLSPVSVETPPLSPGEAHWNSEDILGSSAHNVSYAGSGASNTSSDIIVHAEKRGSSEHLDPISPPPKTECEEDSLQDCVDLIRDPSPATSDSKVIESCKHYLISL